MRWKTVYRSTRHLDSRREREESEIGRIPVFDPGRLGVFEAL